MSSKSPAFQPELKQNWNKMIEASLWDMRFLAPSDPRWVPKQHRPSRQHSQPQPCCGLAFGAREALLDPQCASLSVSISQMPTTPRATWEVVRIQVVSSRLLQVKKIRENDRKKSNSTNIMKNLNGHHWCPSTINKNMNFPYSSFLIRCPAHQITYWKIIFYIIIYFWFDRYARSSMRPLVPLAVRRFNSRSSWIL